MRNKSKKYNTDKNMAIATTIAAIVLFIAAFTLPKLIWEAQTGKAQLVSIMVGYVVSVWFLSYACVMSIASYRSIANCMSNRVRDLMLNKLQVLVRGLFLLFSSVAIVMVADTFLLSVYGKTGYPVVAGVSTFVILLLMDAFGRNFSETDQ